MIETIRELEEMVDTHRGTKPRNLSSIYCVGSFGTFHAHYYYRDIRILKYYPQSGTGGMYYTDISVIGEHDAGMREVITYFITDIIEVARRIELAAKEKGIQCPIYKGTIKGENE